MAMRPIFVGRKRELAELADLLPTFPESRRTGAPRGRFVTLWGSGGAGKTTLARHHADDMHRRGQAVVWLDLAPARTRTDVVTTLAAELGVSLDIPDDPCS